jgi:hypothetical protein
MGLKAIKQTLEQATNAKNCLIYLKLLTADGRHQALKTPDQGQFLV